MSDNFAIKIEGVSKTYELGVKKSDSFRLAFSKFFHKSTKKSAFNALKDINLKLERGEVLGIIGKNGAGKSTLLKVLSQITKPTKGRIEINGRVASLLEVGTGFHPELTGRENIFLNGTILGMTRKEVKAKFDEIVAFSGVEKFIDTPVKHYSSGMYVRLAFSVAAFLEPEILIIDEVLAVGDAEFQKKCLGKMEDVAGKGRTVIFVSHNMAAVRNLCTKAILLEAGSKVFEGNVDEALNIYRSKSSCSTWKLENNTKSQLFFKSIKGEYEDKSRQIKLTIGIDSNSHNFLPSFLAIYISNSDSVALSESIPKYEKFIDKNIIQKDLVVFLNASNFIPGNYKIGLWIGPNHSTTYDWLKEIIEINVFNNPVCNRTIPFPKHAGSFILESKVI